MVYSEPSTQTPVERVSPSISMTKLIGLHRTGFHAQLIERVALQLNEGEYPDAYLYRLSTTFDDSSVFRHLDFLGLRGNVVTMIHVDELPVGVRWYAHLTPVGRLKGVEMGSLEVSEMPQEPLFTVPEEATGLSLFLPVSITQNVELSQMVCDDPECTADHGWAGSAKDEGLLLSFTDNPEESSSTDEVVAFVTKLLARMSQ